MVDAPPDPAPATEPELLDRDAAASPMSRASRVVIAPTALPSVGGTWTSQGPGPIVNGQVEGITGGHVSGAVHAIVAHPSNADIVWMGAVNGGVWKTTNATNASPTWTSMGDTFASLSIGALVLDPTDGTHNTLVAGIGRYSSFAQVGGPRTGLLRTTDGGTNWTELNPASLTGKNISGVAARGATIVVSVNAADSFTCGNIGIWRSTNTGGLFTIVSGGGSGLPQGRSFDLASDPTNNAVLYTVVKDAVGCSSVANGVFKSTDTGATWTRVSDATMEALMAVNNTFTNARLAVGLSGQVYIGIMNNGRLSGLFRSPNGNAASWTQLDTPSTNEGGTPYGMHPREKPGAQGGLHFSIVADPTDANIVYVGGDRQPGAGDTGIPSFPNSLGANNYTGRLFRVNASGGAGTQATPLTHCATATAACNNTQSTTSNSAPHADSRRMVFDFAGNILEGDDGGIFRRTNPRTTGDWFSLNGTLRVTEIHDIAYDTVSNMIIGGNQDNGTAEQATVGATQWNSVSSGDGGDVAVDDVSSGTQSIRYSSFQNLGSFRKRTMNASGGLVTQAFPALTVTSGGPFVGQFATPVDLNAIDPARLLIAGNNDIYESPDRGDTIAALTFSKAATAIVYGGKSGGVDNAALIYAIATTDPATNDSNVYVRTSGSGAPTLTVTAPGTVALRDIAVDRDDWQKAYVVNNIGEVYSTANSGTTWTNITGNLAGGTTDLRTIIFVPGSPSAILVGGVNGVFRMVTDNAGVWNQFGTGLTNTPVWDLDYDAADDVLVAATMGRGAWKINPVSNLGPLPTLSINDVVLSEGNAGTSNAVFTVSLSAISAQTVTVNYATADGTATSGVATISNAAAIAIPSSGNATPYPSTIAVSGTTGTITKVTATLNGFTHTYTSDVDVLLVGPGGQSVVLMSDAGLGSGAGSTATNLNLTFDDAAGSPLPASAFVAGAYQPTNIADGQGSDTYGSPAPPSGYAAALSVFNTTSADGTWSLFVVDDVSGDLGTIAGGWTLNITTTTADYVTTSGTVTFPPGSTSQPVSVTVNGDVATEANETFLVNLTGPSNATVLDAQGQGTINNDDGVLAPANVVATATGPTAVGISWTAAAGAASYRVYRSSNNSSYSLVGSPSDTSFSDTTALANTAYLYKVRSFSGSESADSNKDLATTVIFTDPTLTAGATTVKVVHFNELLTAVNAVRTLASLGGIAFTAPTPATSVSIRRQHVIDLRTNLDSARNVLTLTALSYTDPSITATSTTVKAAHLTEVRDGVK